MKTLLRHILRHREIYIFVPLAIGLLMLAIYGVTALTGRPIVDDPGAIVSWLYNFIGCILIVVLAGQTQEHLFGFRSDGRDTTFGDDVFDACVSFALLIFFAWLLRH